MTSEVRGLWKGKRLDNGEWVQGYLRRKPTFITSTAWEIYADGTRGTDLGLYGVDPATLCECSGLPDKSGIYIFNGDICRLGHPKTERTALCVVNYGRFMDEDSLEDFLGWYLTCPGFENQAVSIFSCEKEGRYLEVIGNIFDNPELLKEG